MEQIFILLDFFATGAGLLVIAAIAAAIVLVWNWRIALPGMFVVQAGIGAIGVAVYELPAQWLGLQLIVTLLATVVLAISAQQSTDARALRQAGNWVVRLLALIIAAFVWRQIDLNTLPPALDDSTTALLGWLALCVVLLLGLGDSPLFTTVGLLLWTMVGQFLLAVLIPSQNLFALIGGLGLLIALGGSYLMLLDAAPSAARAPILTDITFPYPQRTATQQAAIPDDDPMADMAPLPSFVQRLAAEPDNDSASSAEAQPSVTPVGHRSPSLSATRKTGQ